MRNDSDHLFIDSYRFLSKNSHIEVPEKTIYRYWRKEAGAKLLRLLICSIETYSNSKNFR